MGKTKRTFRTGYKPERLITGSDSKMKYWGTGLWGGRKMLPYALNIGTVKFKAEKTDLVPGLSKGVSKYDKLITNNANRSLKKGIRQKLLKELREQLL